VHPLLDEFLSLAAVGAAPSFVLTINVYSFAVSAN